MGLVNEWQSFYWWMTTIQLAKNTQITMATSVGLAISYFRFYLPKSFFSFLLFIFTSLHYFYLTHCLTWGHLGQELKVEDRKLFAEELRFFSIYYLKGSNTSVARRRKWNIAKTMLIKIQPDATVCRYLFTAKSLYMFRVSQHPSSRVLKTVTAASGTGHNIGTATSLQCCLIGPLWREVEGGCGYSF